MFFLFYFDENIVWKTIHGIRLFSKIKYKLERTSLYIFHCEDKFKLWFASERCFDTLHVPIFFHYRTKGAEYLDCNFLLFFDLLLQIPRVLVFSDMSNGDSSTSPLIDNHSEDVNNIEDVMDDDNGNDNDHDYGNGNGNDNESVEVEGNPFQKKVGKRRQKFGMK